MICLKVILGFMFIAVAKSNIHTPKRGSADEFCGFGGSVYRFPDDSDEEYNYGSFSSGQDDNKNGPITVEVVVTNVILGYTPEEGYVNDHSIDKQIEKLNIAYRNASISFTLKKTKRLHQESWFTDPVRTREQTQQMLRAMQREGDYKTLNLIYVKELWENSLVLGNCYLPMNLHGNHRAFLLDSCMIQSRVADANSTYGASGSTTIHEAGHWFGLAHFNATKCEENNEDYCPGGDPLANYMYPYAVNHGPPQRFSPFQIRRLRQLWFQYRTQDFQLDETKKRKTLDDITWEHINPKYTG